MKLDKTTQKRVVNALYDLVSYMEDAEIMHDTHHMYSAQDRREHKRKMASIENLIGKFPPTY